MRRASTPGASTWRPRTRFAGNRSVALVYSLQHAEDTRTGRPAHRRPLAAGAAFRQLRRRQIRDPVPEPHPPRVTSAWPPATPRPEVDGYGLFDVVARVHNFHHSLELVAVGRDLFGRDYFDPSPLGGLPGDYPRAGRSIFIKAKYRF